MNVEIGTEAAQFPEKEYINGIFVTVHISSVSRGSSEYSFSLAKIIKKECSVDWSSLNVLFF